MKKAILFILMVCSVWTAGCRKREPETTRETEPIAVKIIYPAERQISEELSVNGTAASLRTVEVFSDVAGKVIDKYAQLGSSVQKGDMLLRIIQEIPGMEFSAVGIEAPIDGVILNEFVEKGSRLTPQKPCFVIGVIDTILVNARFLENDFSRVQAGSSCRVCVEALSNTVLTGRLRRFSPIVDSRTRTAIAEILVPNPSRRLMPGMSVTCGFTVGRRRALTVPLDALLRFGADYRLVKVVNGRAQFVTVAGGVLLDEEMEIIGEIAPTDPVVVYGQNLLQDGSPVRILAE